MYRDDWMGSAPDWNIASCLRGHGAVVLGAWRGICTNSGMVERLRLGEGNSLRELIECCAGGEGIIDVRHAVSLINGFCEESMSSRSAMPLNPRPCVVSNQNFNSAVESVCNLFCLLIVEYRESER